MAQDTQYTQYTNVLLEEIRDQNKVVLEAVGSVQDKIETLASKEDLKRVEAKVDIIQTAVTATNKEVRDHEQRITILEQAA
jgi:hypothetical protein